MNCCDEFGNCRQGCNCPVRVAKVGQRYPRYPQPPFVPYLNRQLRSLAKWMLLALFGWLIWMPLIYLVLRA